jgi:hypothetical protein
MGNSAIDYKTLEGIRISMKTKIAQGSPGTSRSHCSKQKYPGAAFYIFGAIKEWVRDGGHQNLGIYSHTLALALSRCDRNQKA